MTGEELYAVWAADSTWSRWVKPVLFAHATPWMLDAPESKDVIDSDTSWAPRADGGTAIVIDLSGPMSVVMGLAVAALGYRPVPLYNAVPKLASELPPIPLQDDDPGDDFGLAIAPRPQESEPIRVKAAVDMYPILWRMAEGAERLRSMKLSPDAPPAFLLDSRRRGDGVVLGDGDFDNRSISLPTDFPSANFLRSRGISNVVVAKDAASYLEQDLSHTLRRWQDAGIRILTWSEGAAAQPQPLQVPRPPHFRHMWYGLLARMGLRRDPLGGFGGFLPVPSEFVG